MTLHAIRVGGARTRVELAGITWLTAPAIANITRRLLDEGLIEEAGQRRGGRGQPPTRIAVRRDACHSIGVNIDRDHVTLVLVDFAGQILARAGVEADFALPEDVRTFYRAQLPVLLRNAGVDAASLVGIGVALPDQLGTVDMPGRPAAHAAWEGADIAALFDGPLDLPVFVENDAAAAAMGEMQFGHGQQCANFFYVLISSGLGGGLVIDGAYVRGAHGRSGELGFLRAGRPDGSDEQIQALVSRTGLAGSLAEDGFGLADALAGGTLPDALDRSVGRWIERAAERLCTPLDAVNCLINPAMVLVGGRLPAGLVDRLAERVNALLRHHAGQLPALAPVVRAALAEDAPAVGAAILPFSHFLLPKAAALWKAPVAQENAA